MKIQFEDNSRRFPFETSLNNVHNMDKVLGDPTASAKPRLIMVDKVVDERLDSSREASVSNFYGTIFEGDGGGGEFSGREASHFFGSSTIRA